MSLFDTSPMSAAGTRGMRRLRWRRGCGRGRWRSMSGRSICWGRASRCGWRLRSDDPTSMIFWGPPGTGKTTLAKIIAQMTQASFIEFSAVMSGIKEIKNVMVEAEKAAELWVAHDFVCG